MEAQRDHVLGKPHREDGLEDQLLAQANQQQDENTEDEEDRGYISLGADAELDQIVYEGSSYGTATFAGSEEEADYIGLPGLLGADDVKALLRQREKEQVKQRTSVHASGPGSVSVVGADPALSGATIPGNVAGAGAHAGAAAERVASAAELKDLRRQLNTLVSVYSGRLGKSHGAIHTQLRNACGGPPVPMASAEQIRERIALLRSW